MVMVLLLRAGNGRNQQGYGYYVAESNGRHFSHLLTAESVPGKAVVDESQC